MHAPAGEEHGREGERKRQRAGDLEERQTVDPDLFVTRVVQEHEVMPTVSPETVIFPRREGVDVGADALQDGVATTRGIKVDGVIAIGQIRLGTWLAGWTGRVDPKRRTG